MITVEDVEKASAEIEAKHVPHRFEDDVQQALGAAAPGGAILAVLDAHLKQHGKESLEPWEIIRLLYETVVNLGASFTYGVAFGYRLAQIETEKGE